MIIAAIGVLKPRSPELILQEDYLKRISWNIAVKEKDIRSFRNDKDRQQKEGEALLDMTKKSPLRIVLDERGKLYDSKGFASTLQGWMMDGEVSFLIGGADGHASSVRDEAHALLSLGKMTWPHKLVRVLLAEQLYRAYTILHQHPYHRE